MAIFRKVHTSFWSDPFIQDLDNDHKLFYMYLLTNEKTKQCGIYEISKKQIAFELGYSIDRVSKLLAYFIKTGKILYSEDTKEVALKNWMKYNGSTSPKVVSCIESELCNVKDRVLIEYVKGIYTASQEEEEEEKEEEEEQKQEKDILIDGRIYKKNELFDLCWKSYLRKEGKAEAKKAWEKLTIEDILLIRKHLPLYKKENSAKEKRYIPHFSTYLNKRRFEDEVEASNMGGILMDKINKLTNEIGHSLNNTLQITTNQ
jgi:hypothetical protein